MQGTSSGEQPKIESCLSDLVNTSTKFKDLLQVKLQIIIHVYAVHNAILKCYCGKNQCSETCFLCHRRV